MEWIKIFSSEQEAFDRLIKNKPQLVIINTMRICLVRVEGKFYAVQDSCTHSGESLSRGQLNYLGEIICPLHSYCYDLRSGRESQSRSHDLKTYATRSDETGFYIAV